MVCDYKQRNSENHILDAIDKILTVGDPDSVFYGNYFDKQMTFYFPKCNSRTQKKVVFFDHFILCVVRCLYLYVF